MKNEKIEEASQVIEMIRILRNNLSYINFNENKKPLSNDNDISYSVGEILASTNRQVSLINSSPEYISDINEYFSKNEVELFYETLNKMHSNLEAAIKQTLPWLECFEKAKEDNDASPQFELAIEKMQTINQFSIPKYPISPGVIESRQVEDLAVIHLIDLNELLKPLTRYLSFNPRSAKEIALKNLKNINKEGAYVLDESTKILNILRGYARSSEHIRRNISLNSEYSKKTLDSININKEKAEGYLKELEKIDSKALGNLEEIISNIEKMNSARERIDLLLDEAQKDRERVSKELDSTQDAISMVKKSSAVADKSAGIIQSLMDKADGVLQKANDVIMTAGSTALGVNFANQYEEAKKLLMLWPIIGGISLIAAISICIYAIEGSNNSGEAAIIIARLAIAPMALIGVWFSANQYIKQKQIIEDYAYKKTLALSLISFKKELKETKSSHEREYILEVLKELHKSPLESLDRNSLKEEIKIIEKMKIDFLKEVSSNLLEKGKGKRMKPENADS